MALGKSSNESNWISFSDIMTGLMVIFMFIAISYMYEVQKKQHERDLIFEEFKETKKNLYSELKKEFNEDFKDWDVEMSEDLSIKFINAKVLFEENKYEIKPGFKKILDKFLPRYFDILLKEEFREKIAEVRIEGHTDPHRSTGYDNDRYIGNVILSQRRSAQVLKHFRNMSYYHQLSDSNEQKLQFWITANGLSYGRPLDSDKKLTEIKEEINDALSRRVEFKVVTKSESLIEEVLKNLEKR